MLSESERTAILEREIAQYASQGYRVTVRTATTAQLVKPKEFSVLAAVCMTLLLLVGLVLYLLIYLAEKDKTVYLSVDASGAVQRMGNELIWNGQITAQPVADPAYAAAYDRVMADWRQKATR